MTAVHIAIPKYGYPMPKRESPDWIQSKRAGKVSQCMARRYCCAYS